MDTTNHIVLVIESDLLKDNSLYSTLNTLNCSIKIVKDEISAIQFMKKHIISILILEFITDSQTPYSFLNTVKRLDEEVSIIYLSIFRVF